MTLPRYIVHLRIRCQELATELRAQAGRLDRQAEQLEARGGAFARLRAAELRTEAESLRGRAQEREECAKEVGHALVLLPAPRRRRRLVLLGFYRRPRAALVLH